MSKNRVRQGHSIYIYDDEIPFIENMLEAKGINKDCLDKEQNILNLSVSYVGFIKTVNRTIEISPKYEAVNLNHILRMYFFVHGNFKNFNDDIFGLDSDILSFDLVSLFLTELENLSRKGLPTDYISVEENLKYAAGSVNYTNTYKNILLKKQEPFNCIRDELSFQTPLNRTLKAALNKVKNYSEDKNEIAFINRYFSNISNVFTRFDLNNVIINSKNYYCKNAFLYAKLILEESFYDSLGGFGGESFLINGDLLFEQFIKKILFTLTNDRYFNDWNIDQEYGIYSNVEKSFKPDILYKFSRIENKALGIIDVKNKFSSIFKNADVYQMLFYAGMLNSQKLILCYPSTYRKKPELLEIYSENFLTKNIYAIFINVCEETKDGFLNSLTNFIEDMYFVITK